MVPLNHVISISNGYNLGYSQVKKTHPDGIPKYSPESDKARLPLDQIVAYQKTAKDLAISGMFSCSPMPLLIYLFDPQLRTSPVSQFQANEQSIIKTERFLAESHHFTPPKTPSPMLFWDHHQA